jgi:hypothetical protein
MDEAARLRGDFVPLPQLPDAQAIRQKRVRRHNQQTSDADRIGRRKFSGSLSLFQNSREDFGLFFVVALTLSQQRQSLGFKKVIQTL